MADNWWITLVGLAHATLALAAGKARTSPHYCSFSLATCKGLSVQWYSSAAHCYAHVHIYLHVAPLNKQSCQMQAILLQ